MNVKNTRFETLSDDDKKKLESYIYWLYLKVLAEKTGDTDLMNECIKTLPDFKEYLNNISWYIQSLCAFIAENTNLKRFYFSEVWALVNLNDVNRFIKKYAW